MLHLVQQRLDKKLHAHGRQAKADVLAAQPTLNSITGAGGFPVKARKWRLSLRVRPAGENEFEIAFAPWLKGSFGPAVGQVVDVLFDPDDHSKVVIDPWSQDTMTNMIAEAQQQAAALGPGVFVLGADGQMTSAASPAGPARDPLDQVQELSDLRDRGALSDDEFQAAKSKILGR